MGSLSRIIAIYYNCIVQRPELLGIIYPMITKTWTEACPDDSPKHYATARVKGISRTACGWTSLQAQHIATQAASIIADKLGRFRARYTVNL